MKQPDRFDTLIDGHEYLHQLEGWQKVEIKGLLRRQHAVYVRLVKKMPCLYADASCACGSPAPRSCKLSRGQLLDAFARYKKGTR